VTAAMEAAAAAAAAEAAPAAAEAAPAAMELVTAAMEAAAATAATEAAAAAAAEPVAAAAEPVAAAAEPVAVAAEPVAAAAEPAPAVTRMTGAPPLLSQMSNGNGNGPAKPPAVVKPMGEAPPPVYLPTPMPAPSLYQYQSGMPSPSQYQYQAPPGGTVSAPSPHPPVVQEVVLDGCQAGVGLGLDDQNRVTLLKPSGRAAVSGLIGLGDRIVTVDGQTLGSRQLQTLLQVQERHVFGVERVGTTLPLEEAFPDVARRLSLTDDPSAPRSPRSPRSPGSKVPAMLRTLSGKLPGRRKSTSRPSSSAGSTDDHMGDGTPIPSPM